MLMLHSPSEPFHHSTPDMAYHVDLQSLWQLWKFLKILTSCTSFLNPSTLFFMVTPAPADSDGYVKGCTYAAKGSFFSLVFCSFVSEVFFVAILAVKEDTIGERLAALQQLVSSFWEATYYSFLNLVHVFSLFFMIWTHLRKLQLIWFCRSWGALSEFSSR